MVNEEKIGGVDSYVLYGKETTYGTAVTPNKVLGLIQNFSPNQRFNYIKSTGFKTTGTTGRTTDRQVSGRYENSATQEFQPIHWAWLEHVIGAVSGAGTPGDPFIYVIAATPPSMTVSANIDNVTTDREELYLGVCANNCTIKTALGEVVSATLDLVGADLDKDSTVASNVSLPSESVFTFVSATIEIPNGSVVSNIIDSVELSINNNVEIKGGLGSAVGQRPNFKKLDLTLKFTQKYLDETFIDKFLGAATGPLTAATPSPDATVALRFDNGAEHYVDFILSGCNIDEYSLPHTLNEMLTEDITYIAKTITVNEVNSAS